MEGLNKKGRAGELKNFTGINRPHEEPQDAKIRVYTTAISPEDAAQMIVERLLDGAI